MNAIPRYAREQKQKVLDWISKREHQPLLMLWGPRQCGKTTLIKQVLAEYTGDAQYISGDQFDGDQVLLHFPELENIPGPSRCKVWLMRHWDQAVATSKQSRRPFVLVIDEVQKIDNWSQIVKGCWDKDRWEFHHVHVILLGSSPRLLQKGLSESLMGRYVQMDVSHWSYREMAEAFGITLDEYIYYGGYPGAMEHKNDHERWWKYVQEDIVENNLRRDVLGLMDIQEPEVLESLYAMGCSHSGQIFSYEKILGHLQGGSKKLLMRYLGALGQVFMLMGLTRYTTYPYRRLSGMSSPKFQVLNTALMSVRYGYTFEEARSRREHWGRLVESAVGAHLANTCYPGASLHYWRQEDGRSEVDFVMARGPRLVAFEVKSGGKKAHADGFKALNERFQVSAVYVIGAGGLSLEEFFSHPAKRWVEAEAK